MILKNYVIHVTGNAARHAHIVEQFGNQEIDFEFFAAVTPTTIHTVAVQLGINIANTPCSTGEISCLLSHVSLWRHCVEAQLDFMGVFEDDIYLGENSNLLLTDDDWLKKLNQPIIKLEKFSRRVHLGKPAYDIKDTNRHAYPLLTKNLGTAGYFISQQGARYLLDFVRQLPQLEAIDVLMFDNEKYPKTIPTYLVEPACVIQAHKLNPSLKNDLASQIRASRSKSLTTTKSKNPLTRVYRELQRAAKPLYMHYPTFK